MSWFSGLWNWNGATHCFSRDSSFGFLSLHNQSCQPNTDNKTFSLYKTILVGIGQRKRANKIERDT